MDSKRWSSPIKDGAFELTGYKIEMAGMTDRGLVRPSNEDSLVVLQGPTLPSRYMAVAGVFDGVGGQAHGAMASSLAATHLAQVVGDSSSPIANFKKPLVELEELMQQLHEGLKMELLRDPSLQGMATTVTLAILFRDFPSTLWIGHVGDSPAYRHRSGQLQKLIREDSVVCDMVDEGLVAPEDAVRHPNRHIITQALGGHGGISPHVTAHDVEPGDLFMLCTDGLTNMVTEVDIGRILDAETPPEACKKLIEAANNAGGADNVTVIVMRLIS